MYLVPIQHLFNKKIWDPPIILFFPSSSLSSLALPLSLAARTTRTGGGRGRSARMA